MSRFKFRLLKCLSYPQNRLTAGLSDVFDLLCFSKRVAADNSQFWRINLGSTSVTGGITQSNKADKRSQRNAVTAFLYYYNLAVISPHHSSKTALFLCPAPHSRLPWVKWAGLRQSYFYHKLSCSAIQVYLISSQPYLSQDWGIVTPPAPPFPKPHYPFAQHHALTSLEKGRCSVDQSSRANYDGDWIWEEQNAEYSNNAIWAAMSRFKLRLWNCYYSAKVVERRNYTKQ